MYEFVIIAAGLALFLGGWYVGRFSSTAMFAHVNGSGNYVDQRGAASDGDIVGGDLVKPKSAACEYCGAK